MGGYLYIASISITRQFTSYVPLLWSHELNCTSHHCTKLRRYHHTGSYLDLDLVLVYSPLRIKVLKIEIWNTVNTVLIAPIVQSFLLNTILFWICLMNLPYIWQTVQLHVSLIKGCIRKIGFIYSRIVKSVLILSSCHCDIQVKAFLVKPRWMWKV